METCSMCHACGKEREALVLLREIRDLLRAERAPPAEAPVLPAPEKRKPGRPRKG